MRTSAEPTARTTSRRYSKNLTSSYTVSSWLDMVACDQRSARWSRGRRLTALGAGRTQSATRTLLAATQDGAHLRGTHGDGARRLPRAARGPPSELVARARKSRTQHTSRCWCTKNGKIIAGCAGVVWRDTARKRGTPHGDRSDGRAAPTNGSCDGRRRAAGVMRGRCDNAAIRRLNMYSKPN